MWGYCVGMLFFGYWVVIWLVWLVVGSEIDVKRGENC